MAYVLTMLPTDVTREINNIVEGIIQEERRRKQVKKDLAEDAIELVQFKLNTRVSWLNGDLFTKWENKEIAIYNDQLGLDNHEDFDFDMMSPAEADWEYLKAVYYFNGFVHKNMHLEHLLYDQERYLFACREP